MIQKWGEIVNDRYKNRDKTVDKKEVSGTSSVFKKFTKSGDDFNFMPKIITKVSQQKIVIPETPILDLNKSEEDAYKNLPEFRRSLNSSISQREYQKI